MLTLATDMDDGAPSTNTEGVINRIEHHGIHRLDSINFCALPFCLNKLDCR